MLIEFVMPFGAGYFSNFFNGMMKFFDHRGIGCTIIHFLTVTGSRNEMGVFKKSEMM